MLLKQKYPGHYLWKDELFDMPEYAVFEQQLSSVVNSNEGQLHMAQHLDVLVPELASVMREGFESLNTSISAVQAQNEAYRTMLENSERATRAFIADSFRQAASRIEGVPAFSSIPLVLSQEVLVPDVIPVSSVEASLPGPSNESSTATILAELPAYKMDRTILNVVDVWREYTAGIGGGPSVEYLEKNFQTKWRKDRTESRFFSSRSVIYNEIRRISERDFISKEEAASILERRRQELGFTLYKLTKCITATNKENRQFI